MRIARGAACSMSQQTTDLSRDPETMQPPVSSDEEPGGTYMTGPTKSAWPARKRMARFRDEEIPGRRAGEQTREPTDEGLVLMVRAII